MSFDYTVTVATATRLLARFGFAMTLVHTAANAATTITTPKGVIESQVRHTLADSGVQVGDFVIYLEPSAAPSETDTLTITGERYAIVRVEPIMPGGVVVLWRVWARRA